VYEAKAASQANVNTPRQGAALSLGEIQAKSIFDQDARVGAKNFDLFFRSEEETANEKTSGRKKFSTDA
jgi:hypothetical protein